MNVGGAPRSGLSALHNDAIVERARKGQQPAEIAAALGISRNIAIGVIHRARVRGELPAPASWEGKSPERKPRPKPAARPAPGPMAFLRPVVLPERKPVAAAEAVARWGKGDPMHYPADMRCQWIEGDWLQGAGFCGAERVHGRPYCCEHVARAYYRRPVAEAVEA